MTHSFRFAAAALLTCGIAHPTASRELRFHPDARELTNVAYHVSCLGGQVSCTNAVFERFWHEQNSWTPADQSALDDWSRAFSLAEHDAPQPPPAVFLPTYLGYYPSLVMRQQLVAAALGADTIDEFRIAAARVIPAPDAGRSARALDHFRQRLHPWWRTAGEPRLRATVERVGAVIREHDLAGMATGMSDFLKADLPTRDVYIHAIAGPVKDSKESAATVVNNHFVIEVVDDTEPEGAASIAMHELTHYYFDRIDPSRHRTLMKQFADAHDPAPGPFYGFLNEAMATAMQLRVLGRLGLTDDDPYHDAFIPRLGRALVRVLDQWLDRHESLFDGFVAEYLRRGRAELGGDASAPRFVFSSTALLAGPRQSGAVQAFSDALQPRFTVTTVAEWQRFAELNAVAFATYDELEEMQKAIPGVPDVRARRAYVYLLPHGTRSLVCAIVGRDEQALRDGVTAFARVPSVKAGQVIAIE